jgi:hypothetical protein
VGSRAEAPGQRPVQGRSSPGTPTGSRQPGESPRPAPAERAWGTRPARLGPITVIFGALAGGLLTVLAGSEPGWLLGLFVIIATTAGASAVRRTSAYIVIPVPALAYFVIAVIAGLIHDRGVDTSRAILFVNAVQWIAGGFFWMCLATIIAIAIAIGRWLMTGRAGYRAGGSWLARMSGAWAPSEATMQGADAPSRPPAGRPGSARSASTRSEASRPDSTRSGAARSASTRSEASRPDSTRSGATQSGSAPSEDASTEPLGPNPPAAGAGSADASHTQPIPRETLDHEHSAES